MKADLPKYREIIELNDDLFSVIPSSWKMKRLKFLLPEVTVGIVITPSKYYAEDGVPAIRSLNVKGGKLIDSDLVFFSERDNEKLKKTQINKGDIVIVRSGQTGASAVVDDRFDGCNCIDLIIVRKSKPLDSHYLHYLLMSKEVQAQVFMSSNGAIQQHFNIGLVRELLILEPPKEDQKAIVTFLDRETEKIDRLMAVRHEQIKHLQEQRAAVIHHITTKGLNSNAKMKPSGIKWLSEIPETWKVKPLWAVAKIRFSNVDKKSFAKEKPVRLCNYIDVYKKERINDTIKFMEATASDSEIESFSLLQGDVLITKDSENPNDIAVPAIVSDKVEGVVCGYHLAMIRPKGELLPSYLFRLFQSKSFSSYFSTRALGVTRFGLSQHAISRCATPLPSLQEQEAIAAHIDHEVGKIDTLIIKYNSEIELLEEYRASLISHAVTGKIDVRGLIETTETELGQVV